MPIDDESYRRVARFCGTLPGFHADPAFARAEALFALGCLSAHRADLERQVGTAGHSASLSTLRCEIDAFDSASAAIQAFWNKRFGSDLRVPDRS